MKNIKLSDLVKYSNGRTVEEVLNYARSFKKSFPLEQPIKPKLLAENTKMAKQYAIDLENWDIECEKHRSQIKQIIVENNMLRVNIYEYIDLETRVGKLLTPIQSQKVWNKALQYHDQEDYYEIYKEIEELIDIFN